MHNEVRSDKKLHYMITFHIKDYVIYIGIKENFTTASLPSIFFSKIEVRMIVLKILGENSGDVSLIKVPDC